MHEAFWNGLFDTRWEDALLGPEAIRLVLRLRQIGYAERTWRQYGHSVVHLGRVLHKEVGGANRVLDETVIEDFVEHHLPVCRCYGRALVPRLNREDQKTCSRINSLIYSHA
jgi:hypothetical protein